MRELPKLCLLALALLVAATPVLGRAAPAGGGFTLALETRTAAYVADALAKMPGLPELRAKLLGLFNQPATMLARTIAAPSTQLARVIGARQEQLAKQG